MGELRARGQLQLLFSVTQVLSALGGSCQCFPDLCMFSNDSVNVLEKFHLLCSLIEQKSPVQEISKQRKVTGVLLGISGDPGLTGTQRARLSDSHMLRQGQMQE